MRLQDDEGCFACGEKNPIGLKLTFQLQGDEAIGYFTPHKNHQGYKGMMHGGLVATLLDEAMAHYLLLKGYLGVTGRLEVYFRHSVPLGVPLTITAGLKKERKDWILLYSQLENRGGILAQGEGLFNKSQKKEDNHGEGRGPKVGEREHHSKESCETLSSS